MGRSSGPARALRPPRVFLTFFFFPPRRRKRHLPRSTVGRRARRNRKGSLGIPLTRKKLLDRHEARQLRELQEEHLEGERREVGTAEKAVGVGEEREHPEERPVGGGLRELREPRRGFFREAHGGRGGGVRREAHGSPDEGRQVA